MAKFPRTILITSTGLVGGNILRVCKNEGLDVVETYYPTIDLPVGYPVDITDNSSLEKVFTKSDPEIIILNAALTNVEFCEEHQDVARKINVQGTANVIKFCKKVGAKLVFFSSDYVFDGENGPYSEDDKTDPVCFYGQTKLEAETLIRQELRNFLIIRTTVVYGFEKLGKNFCYRLINTLKQGKTIKVPEDQIGSPTYALNLVEVVVDLLKKDRNGLYNVVGRDLIDRYRFSLAVCSEFGLNKELVIPVKTQDLKQKAPRPLRAGLKIDKVLRETEVAILDVKESLAKFRKEING